MGPLQAMQQRRSALVSIAGHAALIIVLALGTRTQLSPFQPESPLIFAELVTALSPEAAVGPAAETRETAEGPPEDVVEPEVALEPETVALAPPPVSSESERPQPPAQELDPIAEPPPDERLLEALEPEPPNAPAPAPTPAAETPSGVSEPSIVADAPSKALARNEAETVRRKLSSWTGSISAQDPQPMLTWHEDGQEYTAVLKKLPAGDAMGMEQLAVELTTERDGERLVTELRMTRLAFSNFGQFVNRWDPDVGLNDDVIDGRFHSNTALTINREGRTMPVFGGKVTIADGGLVTGAEGYPGKHVPRLNRRKMFPAGLETRTRRIELPERGTALEAITTPDNSQRFARDAALTFHDDGSVSWRELDGGATEPRRALGEEPFYLLADDDVKLEVSGTVNGKVLVYSPDRIIVTGNLRYAADPRASNADDYLGLVSEHNVEVAEPEVTGSGDLEIFAAIYARQRFVVRDFNSKRSGTLIVHGSLTAGTLSATEPRFATRIEFDDRLTAMRAPSFPLSDRYELDAVSNEWRVLDRP
jgi:hypothetical protein